MKWSTRIPSVPHIGSRAFNDPSSRAEREGVRNRGVASGRGRYQRVMALRVAKFDIFGEQLENREQRRHRRAVLDLCEELIALSTMNVVILLVRRHVIHIQVLLRTRFCWARRFHEDLNKPIHNQAESLLLL
jgi:hypothetical protein